VEVKKTRKGRKFVWEKTTKYIVMFLHGKEERDEDGA
jgi:hypothetical protein